MKYLKMLPAAAGILALTATIDFDSNMRSTERMSALRVNVVARDSRDSRDDIPDSFRPIAIDSESGLVYFASIATDDTPEAPLLPATQET